MGGMLHSWAPGPENTPLSACLPAGMKMKKNYRPLLGRSQPVWARRYSGLWLVLTSVLWTCQAAGEKGLDTKCGGVNCTLLSRDLWPKATTSPIHQRKPPAQFTISTLARDSCTALQVAPTSTYSQPPNCGGGAKDLLSTPVWFLTQQDPISDGTNEKLVYRLPPLCT